MITPIQAADKWQAGLSGSVERYRQGVQAVQTSPAQKAIAQKQKMIDNWLNSVNNGSWENALGNVSLQEWKDATINKGAPRLQQGATEGRAKYLNYIQQAMPFMENLRSQVDAMPSTTLQDNINRMVFWVTEMSQFQMS